MTKPSAKLDVAQTAEFSAWLVSLRDGFAQTIISARIARLRRGLKGDTRSLGGGLLELKIDHGPGYRLYYNERNLRVMLLYGGDKSTQSRDIARARALMEGTE